MNSDTLGGIACVILAFVLGCLGGAALRSPCIPLPTNVPAGLTAAPAEWAFSPTGGYVHVTYKPKEDK